MEAKTIDLGGSGKSVARVVRPHNHIGEAWGGDRVTIGSDELKHPAVARALWTEDEAKKAIAARERQILASMQESVSPAHRAADEQLRRSLEQRKVREEEERKTAPKE